MSRITLVGTVHNVRGLCNENELIKILEMVSPDVIFEEIRQSDYQSFYQDKSKSTLETRVISRYLKSSSAQQVLVDDFVEPENFRRDVDLLFNYVESHSHDYNLMQDEQDQKTFALGFSYLNSNEFQYLSKLSQDLFDTTISLSGKEDLKIISSRWNAILRERERCMLEKIYDFSKKNRFKEGIFFVGAAHLTSIIKVIDERMKVDPNVVTWNKWNIIGC